MTARLIEASKACPCLPGTGTQSGSKGSKRLNSKEQIGTRTKKRNKSGKKKGEMHVNVNNKVKKLGRYMEKRKALTGIKTKRKINSKVNSARQKCSSLATIFWNRASAKERTETENKREQIKSIQGTPSSASKDTPREKFWELVGGWL